MEGRRVTYLSLIPRAQESTPEPYALRAATTEDIPLLRELYNRQRSASMVWAIASERFWRYQIKEEKDPTVVGKQMGFYPNRQSERICIIQCLERNAREDLLQCPLTQLETGNLQTVEELVLSELECNHF